jgi:hypothetical protein
MASEREDRESLIARLATKWRYDGKDAMFRADFGEAYDSGYRARDAEVAAQAVKVAKEVGGHFWEMHRLNTGLLKFIQWLRLSGEKG